MICKLEEEGFFFPLVFGADTDVSLLLLAQQKLQFYFFFFLQYSDSAPRTR
jgi:hypothetical protein